MRVSVLRLLRQTIGVIAISAWLSATGMAQSDPGGGSFAGASGGTGEGGPAGVMPGGAAQADFNTLMNLIQQTIDPDSWLAAGGTSSILPYPSGVFVDPAGHMKRLQEAPQLSIDGLSLDRAGLKTSVRHPWRKASNLRTVSLKQIDRAIEAAAAQGLRPSNEILRMAGLSKIAYVKLDAANEDILLAGPAGEQVFGFELQDLAVVAALIQANTMPLGCSIEPTDAGIVAAQEMLKQPGAVEKLARNPRMVVEQMQEKIGPHNVQVFGMAKNTGTAVALIDADEHMKKVGFGTVATRTPISSYFDYLDQQSHVPSQSLIRWWFAYSDDPIRVSTSGDLFELPKQCVAVLSEQQWVSQQGRAPTGGNDVAADQFAEGITKQLPELRATHSSCARLCAVFELGLSLQLAIEATGQPSLQAWFPNLCSLGAAAPESNVQPKTVEGLTTWHRLKTGTIVAVVSGGVKIDARSVTAKDKWIESKFLVGSLVPEQSEEPSSAHGRWWWDQR